MQLNPEINNLPFDLPKNQSNVIKVIGVGGGGSNAINYMHSKGIKGVDFVVCNTDSQALENSRVENKIQLGISLTEGLGAGANPEIGEKAAMESFDDLKKMLETNTKMVFITAGMGGGTGTGAAPVISKLAKELDILTVGIVTMPFQFEGKIREQQAKTGIEKLRKEVDALIVINNNNLRDIYGNLGFKEGFAKADEVLATASRGIAEVISVTGVINVDFNDVNTVLRNSGHAIMGSASAEGENRALEAVTSALTSPLLMDNEIDGARYVLLNITYGSKEVMMDEITEITDYIQEAAGATADVIWGHGLDSSLGEKISITLIAAGLKDVPLNGFEKAPERKVVDLHGENNKEITSLLTNPVSSVEGSGNSKDAFSEEPFLKSEQITDNTIPADSISQNFGEKKSFGDRKPSDRKTSDRKPAAKRESAPKTFAKKPTTIRTFRASDSKSEPPKRKARV